MKKIRFIGQDYILVRSFGNKTKVESGEIIEVSENEFNSLKTSYKNLFEFDIMDTPNEEKIVEKEKPKTKTKKEEKIVEEEKPTETPETKTDDDPFSN